MASAFIYVGCAGWSLPAAEKHRFPAAGAHLARYAASFSAVEINSSFTEVHRPATYARWAASVPASFRFSVKIPKVISHERGLSDVKEPLASFLAAVRELEEKLGALLLQLPPTFEFDARVAEAFLAQLRGMYAGAVVLEPRHATWFTADASRLLDGFQIRRVAADPLPADAPGAAATWTNSTYFRLHGSPRIYYSSYSNEYLDELATKLTTVAARGAPVWCIFDNTALRAATANAFYLMQRLAERHCTAGTGGDR